MLFLREPLVVGDQVQRLALGRFALDLAQELEPLGMGVSLLTSVDDLPIEHVQRHYDDSVKEITVGKTEVVGQGDQRRVLGHVIKFTSKQGRITEI